VTHLRLGRRLPLDLEHAERPVRLPAVLKPRDRLLAGVAALREADVGLGQARLGRENTIVDLTAPARPAGEDPHALELLLVEELGRRLGVEDFHSGRAELVVRDSFVLAEEEHGCVVLRLDLDLRREAGASERRSDDLAEPVLGQKEVVVIVAANDDHRCDDSGLRRQQQSRTGRALDVVRDHSLQKVLRLGAANGDIVARPDRCARRNDSHGN
jgi:hypothetical protein